MQHKASYPKTVRSVNDFSELATQEPALSDSQSSRFLQLRDEGFQLQWKKRSWELTIKHEFTEGSAIAPEHHYYKGKPIADLKISPCIGREAFDGYNRTLIPKDGSTEIWYKFGHGQFFVTKTDANGKESLYSTKKTGEGAETRVIDQRLSDDPYAYLRSLSEAVLNRDAEGKLPSGGIFTIPTQPIWFPGKEAIDSTDDLGCEMDNGSKEEQIDKWQRFAAVSGLTPSSLLTSGGKSIHGHIKLDLHYPLEQADYLRRLLCLGMIGDAAVINVHQPMRVPGFFRSDKKTEQELLLSSDRRYPPDAVVNGLRAWFEVEGLPFPERISDQWWIHLKRSLKTAEKGNRQPLIDALSEGIDEWGRKLHEVREASQQRKLNASLNSTKLIDAVNETNNRLGEQAFNLRNHGWIGTSKHKRGNCTFHESTSGSAWLSELNGQWLFNCQTCGKGIDAFRYWLSDRRNGILTSYPKGQEWATLAKEFLNDHGVTYLDDWHPSVTALSQKQKAGQGFGEKETEQRDPNWNEPDRELYEAHQARTEKEWQNLQAESKNENIETFPLLRWNPDSLNHIRRIQSEKPNFDQEEQKRRTEKTCQKIAQMSAQWKLYQRDFKLTVQESDRYNIHRFDGYAPIFLPWQDTIYIRAGFGGGKTEAYLLSLLEEQWRDRCVVVVTPTNLLGENLIARARAKGIAAMAYQSDVLTARSRLHRNTPGLIVMCPDSFKKYSTGETSWKEKALFIDEFSTVRSHILDKTASLPHLAKGIKEAAFLMIADANLGNADVSAIENTFGRNQGTSRLYIQNHKKDSTPVKVVQTLNKEGQISGTHDGVWFNLLEYAISKRSEALDRGEKLEPIYLCSDNLTVLLVLQIWLERTHPDLKIKRVSSLDVETNYGFMSAPDVAMAAENIDILLGSPSMQSGCDIQTRFGTTIGIFTGVCTPLEAMQHIKRVRNAREILLSIPTFSYRNEEAANLDRRSRKRLTKQAKNIFKAEGIETAGDLQAFGVWQEQIAKLNAQFNHELTCAIACETFENIEYVYFEGGQSALYKEIHDEVKTDNALKTLTANHIKGKELIDAKKAPSRNQHVWDIKKAQLYKQFPDLVDALAEDLKAAITAKAQGEGTKATEALYRDVLQQGKILLSSKLEKLKNHAIANSVDVEKHLESMTEALLHSHPTLYSKRFKLLRAIKLYYELSLVDLAKLGRSASEEAEEGQIDGELSPVLNQNVYSAESPIFAELYTKFVISEVSKFYPEVATVQQFWKVVNAAIRACGHKQFAHEVRVESDQARPNGNFRGIARETYSTKQYFVGFYRIEQSGNKVFRKHFTKFMDAVETLIDRELENQQAWREKRKRTDESPPDWGEVAA